MFVVVASDCIIVRKCHGNGRVCHAFNNRACHEIGITRYRAIAAVCMRLNDRLVRLITRDSAQSNAIGRIGSSPLNLQIFLDAPAFAVTKSNFDEMSEHASYHGYVSKI